MNPALALDYIRNKKIGSNLWVVSKIAPDASIIIAGRTMVNKRDDCQL